MKTLISIAQCAVLFFFIQLSAYAQGPLNPLCNEFVLPGGSIVPLNGSWTSGPNKLYSECPQIKVGINTSTPRVRLDVRGDGYMNRFMLGAVDPSAIPGPMGAGTKFLLKAPTFSQSATTWPHYNLFKIENDLNSLFEIDYSGKIKIKTSHPSTETETIFLVENDVRKLFQIENNGLVRAREIKVDLATNWPDYVFEADYLLEPLSNVKDFIEKNGHLKGVPSSLEIEEEGIALGEMNKILLEKVEELTLHLIEQNEKIEKLEKRLNSSNH